MDTAGRAHRSSAGPRHWNSSSHCEYRQLDNWCGNFRDPRDSCEGTRLGGATRICLLCDCDGLVRHVFRDCRQPCVINRRPLRVCGSRLRPLRRVPRGHALFLTALGAVAGVVNVLANSVALVVPFLGSPVMRIFVMFAVYGLLVFINIRGVREGAGAVTVITVAKLLPLLLFICVGIFSIHAPNFAWGGWPTSKSLGDAVILLIFAFVGIEVALIPSGEVKNPARTVPRSAYLALVITTIIYIMIQLVAQGTLGLDLANHPNTPLAEAAARFLGNVGRTILLAGATISAFGFVTSDILSSPRILFAFGRDGVIPAWFAHVHPRYRSPDVAIIAYAAIAFAFSVTSTFEALAVLSNVAVLLMYFLCCVACWILVQRDIRADGLPFNFPGARFVPALAIVAIVWILAHATVREFAVNGAVLIVASL